MATATAPVPAPTTDRLNEILAQLPDEEAVAAKTDDEIATLRDELRAIGLAISAGTIEGVEDPVALLGTVADHYEGCVYVLGVRAEEAAAREEALTTQAARLGAEPTPVEPEPDPEPVEPVEEPTAPLAVEPEPAPIPAPVAAVPVEASAATPAPVAAPAPALPALSTITPPAIQAPATQLARTEPRIMRLRDREYVDVEDFVETIMEAHDAFLSMAGGASEKVPLGRIKTEWRDDRTLTGVDEQTANRRLSQLLDRAYLPEKWTQALVASGGFCAPAMPDYTVPVIAGTQRPVAGYLPTVNMERGRSIVITPPALASIATSTGTTAGSAVSIWTQAADVAASPAKPKQSITCAATQTISTQAIVERLRVGNFMAKADPELVRAWMELTAAAWARVAESQLLAQIDGFSLALTTAQVLGVTNDFFGYLHQAAAGMRNRQRMPYNARLRVLIPAWFIDFVGSDLAHNHPGDGLERFTQDPEAFVRAAFNAANVNVTFYEDTAAGGTNQLFSTPTGGADVPNYPPGPASTSARCVWYLFPEGTYARGDAGTLDLGIVRDSTLNDTNDYEFFSESWETVVPHVIESQRITSTLCTTGSGAIDVTAAAYCTAS